MRLKKVLGLTAALMLSLGVSAAQPIDAAPPPSFSVERADRFLSRHKTEIDSRWYPSYHVAAPCGWVNDPNGFAHFDGRFHLFYQHYPYEPKWGPMHWGHVAGDLAHWTRLPVALAPDRAYDIGDTGGCFSGGAIEKDGKLYLIYTGHIESADGSSKREVQNVAFSRDGVRFEKSAKNPVLEVPRRADVSSVDFRDPKVWEHDGSYWLALGSKTNDSPSLGQVLLFQSSDLERWQFKNVMARARGDQGFMWECPGFASIGDRELLIVSPIVKRDGREVHVVNGLLGELDYSTGVFKHGEPQPIDHGFDFYAPQLMQAPDGRCLLIGWLDNWDNEMPEKSDGWAGMMTLPRELSLNNGKIMSTPARELESLRRFGVTYENFSIEKETKLDGIRGSIGELLIDVEPEPNQKFEIKLRASKSEATVLSYDNSTGIFAIDRDRSGKGPGGTREVKLAPSDRLKLRIFLDRSSIEIFLNDGEAVLSNRVYPKAKSDEIVFVSERALKINRVSFYKIADAFE